MSGERPAVREIQISAESEGQRIDNFLLRVLKGVPKTRVYRLLRKGEVRVNRGRVKPGHKLRIGDRVRIPPVRTATGESADAPLSLKNKIEKTIIYEDNLIIVINKPSGLAVHGGSGVSFGAIEALRASRPTEKGLELVHRLDRDTSGCLAIAKKRSALRALQEMQREGVIRKRYLALLSGAMERQSQLVDARLRKNTLRSGERIVRVDPEGKPSRTRFQVLHRYPRATLVEAILETGRTHQIRVHARYIGHPILGDDKYGQNGGRELSRELGLKRLFLHALSLEFPWPEGGRRLHVEAPMPSELTRVLKALGGNEEV